MHRRDSLEEGTKENGKKKRKMASIFRKPVIKLLTTFYPYQWDPGLS